MKAFFTFKNKQYTYKVVNGSTMLIHLGNVPEEDANEIDNGTEYKNLTNQEWDYIFREYNEFHTEQ